MAFADFIQPCDLEEALQRSWKVSPFPTTTISDTLALASSTEVTDRAFSAGSGASGGHVQHPGVGVLASGPPAQMFRTGNCSPLSFQTLRFRVPSGLIPTITAAAGAVVNSTWKWTIRPMVGFMILVLLVGARDTAPARDWLCEPGNSGPDVRHDLTDHVAEGLLGPAERGCADQVKHGKNRVDHLMRQ